MRVLVTGAASPLAGALAARLLARGHAVEGVDAVLGAFPGRFARADDAAAQVARVRPDAVVDLAAPRGVARVVGVAGLLQACAAAGVRKVVGAVDASVYGRPRTWPVGERAGLAPVTSDGAAQAACAGYLAAAARAGLPTTTLVLGEVHGPGVPGLVADLRAGRPVPDVARDLVHLDEVVDALVRALTRGDGRRLHVATGRATPLREVAALLGVPLVPLAADVLPAVALDPTGSRHALGWEPFLPLADALR